MKKTNAANLQIGDWFTDNDDIIKAYNFQLSLKYTPQKGGRTIDLFNHRIYKVVAPDCYLKRSTYKRAKRNRIIDYVAQYTNLSLRPYDIIWTFTKEELDLRDLIS